MFGQSASMKTKMLQLYQERWAMLFETFSNDPDSKLRSYAKFKKSFTMENYVLQFPLHFRRNLTKLRISAHGLAIETGRFTKPKKPIDKRICFHCKQLEDEYHFILKCKLYTSERKNFAEGLKNFCSLNVSPSIECFHVIMSCLNGDAEVGKSVCEFINACCTKRSIALSEKIENDIYLRPPLTITHSGRHCIRPSKLDL